MSDGHHDAPREQEQRETSGSITERTSNRDHSVAEWTTLAISSAILITIIGLITWLSFRGEELPPEITVEPQIELVRQEETGYYLPVVIHNAGDLTVADAIIRGELDTGTGEPEEVDLTVPFLSGGEQVYGTMIFRENPASGELTVGVTSYQEP